MYEQNTIHKASNIFVFINEHFELEIGDKKVTLRILNILN